MIRSHHRTATASAALALVLSAALAGTAAQAASLSLNTGTDAAGNVLVSGSLDSRWSISTDGGTTFQAAKVLYDDQVYPGMETVANTAAWIADQSIADGSIDTGWGVNNLVTLRTTFDLTLFDLSSTTLNATWRLADIAKGIYLNGVELVAPGESDTWFSDINLTAGPGNWLQGLNTLEVRGVSYNSRWDGLWMSALVSDGRNNAVPEPASALLVLAALGGLAASRRRVR